MQVNLNASITSNPQFFSRYTQALRRPDGVKEFNSSKSMPGDVVIGTGYNKGSKEITTVRNTPAERKVIREAIASYLPKFHFWTGYIGDVNRAMGVNHYWEIPSARIPETLKCINAMFQAQPALFPSYSQDPVTPPPVISEKLEEAQMQLEAALSQFQIYKRWFKEQSELMDYAIEQVNKTLAVIR